MSLQSWEFLTLFLPRHEKGQYNENRAYREAMREKAADDLAERERRRERRLMKKMRKKRTIDELEKMRKRVDLLSRVAEQLPGQERVIQRLFNVGVLEAISERKASTL